MLVVLFLISLAVILMFCKDLIVIGGDAAYVANRLDNEKGSICQEWIFSQQWSFILNSSEGYTSHSPGSYHKYFFLPIKQLLLT